ncbi:MAG: bifunctional 5,10-methylenetetrahydrofolate dehydrogenase/5,10-methenyltetrahydrofolate cyclohydrolase [Peptococcaceae bacterium]|nr:bifunctional 5,10-methylenetetrahydrofolate dehydrogenase/5,10-methenyltetrahydrofolate cyclohydrolase [Peptococcaceae bacterium]
MSRILEAKPVIQNLKADLLQDIKSLKDRGQVPSIGLIRVGNRPDDVYYENSIVKNCENMGIRPQKFTLEENISMPDFIKLLKQVNADPGIHGIMIFRPLPQQLDEELLKHIIDPAKDIDCMSPLNQARIFAGDMSGLLPCTPAAVMEILKYYKIELQGAKAVVVGRSMVVGKPLSMMLLKENATVTICHSKTQNMLDICKNADILVAAIGKPKFIDANYVSPQSIVIDVGINDAGDGKMCGDVDFQAVAEQVQAITPVPGGVGSITTTLLLKNVVKAINLQKDQRV